MPRAETTCRLRGRLAAVLVGMIAGGLLLPLGAAAEPGGRGDKPRRGDRFVRMLNENAQRLGLDESALREIEAVARQEREASRALRERKHDERRVMHELLGAGRPDEAAVLLQRAAELAPQDPRVHSQLAISPMATGQREEASAVNNATLDLGADASALGYALAFTHLKAGEFEDALRVTRDLRQRFPRSVLAAHLEGGAHAALGQFDMARSSFEAVLAIDPAFHQARANLAALKARAASAEIEARIAAIPTETSGWRWRDWPPTPAIAPPPSNG